MTRDEIDDIFTNLTAHRNTGSINPHYEPLLANLMLLRHGTEYGPISGVERSALETRMLLRLADFCEVERTRREAHGRPFEFGVAR